jgi:hypothetical protein
MSFAARCHHPPRPKLPPSLYTPDLSYRAISWGSYRHLRRFCLRVGLAGLLAAVAAFLDALTLSSLVSALCIPRPARHSH